MAMLHLQQLVRDIEGIIQLRIQHQHRDSTVSKLCHQLQHMASEMHIHIGQGLNANNQIGPGNQITIIHQSQQLLLGQFVEIARPDGRSDFVPVLIVYAFSELGFLPEKRHLLRQRDTEIFQIAQLRCMASRCTRAIRFFRSCSRIQGRMLPLAGYAFPIISSDSSSIIVLL